MAKIICVQDYPAMLWTAYFSGDEGHYYLHGQGRTEAEALADLARIEEEELEAAIEANDEAYAVWEEDQQRIADAREGFDND